MGWLGHPDGTTEHVSSGKPKWGSQPPKYKLNPCPKCGSERTSLWYVGATSPGGWGAICSDCLHIAERLCRTEEEAVSLWNGDDTS